MPRKLYPGPGVDPARPFRRSRYVSTGAKRPPKAGEYYLSGAVPEVYRAPGDLSDAFHIMREATPEEVQCHTCGQALPDADERPGCDNAGDGNEHYKMGHRVIVCGNPFVDRANGEFTAGPARLCTKCCDRAKVCGYIVRNA